MNLINDNLNFFLNKNKQKIVILLNSLLDNQKSSFSVKVKELLNKENITLEELKNIYNIRYKIKGQETTKIKAVFIFYIYFSKKRTIPTKEEIKNFFICKKNYDKQTKQELEDIFNKFSNKEDKYILDTTKAKEINKKSIEARQKKKELKNMLETLNYKEDKEFFNSFLKSILEEENKTKKEKQILEILKDKEAIKKLIRITDKKQHQKEYFQLNKEKIYKQRKAKSKLKKLLDNMKKLF